MLFNFCRVKEKREKHISESVLRFKDFLCKAHSIIPVLHVRLPNVNEEFIEFIISVPSVFRK